MATITKKELTEKIAAKTRQTRGSVKQTMKIFLDVLMDELAAGNRIEFREFGVFEVKERGPRMAQNPKTLQRLEVPAKRTVKFKAGREMRDRIDAAGKGTKPTLKAGASPNGVLTIEVRKRKTAASA